MKEPICEEVFEKEVPTCPWCLTQYDDVPEFSESFTLTCEHCHESYIVYPTITYTSYPIESEDN